MGHHDIELNEPEIYSFQSPVSETSILNILEELRTKNSNLEEELVKVIIKSIRQEEAMISLSKELKELKKAVKDDLSRKKITKNLKRIEQTLLSHSFWKEFELLFNDLKGNFTSDLKEKYPELTSKDLKVCVYLKMNLSTKEIADLLGISNRSAEDIRYRLRKKFGLQKEESLSNFILSFSS